LPLGLTLFIIESFSHTIAINTPQESLKSPQLSFLR
jgi:hypothetical protein